jgi:putative endonuclease
LTWFVYLLECADHTLYCGVTTDLARRLAQHNGEAPGGARYTRARRPVLLAASAPCRDRAAAQRLEALVKRLPRKAKAEFLAAYAEA